MFFLKKSGSSRDLQAKDNKLKLSCLGKLCLQIVKSRILKNLQRDLVLKESKAYELSWVGC